MSAIPGFEYFVVHPRFGRGPRISGLNVEPTGTLDVFLHWHSPADVRVPNTAITARVGLQKPSTLPVTHYFDSRRVCRSCKRPFLFFAEEQQHWYEELKFLRISAHRGRPFQRIVDGISDERGRCFRLIVDDVSA